MQPMFLFRSYSKSSLFPLWWSNHIPTDRQAKGGSETTKDDIVVHCRTAQKCAALSKNPLSHSGGSGKGENKLMRRRATRSPFSGRQKPRHRAEQPPS